MCGPIDTNVTCTSPPSTAATAGAVPRNGTNTSFNPARRLNSCAARSGVVPTPAEA